MQRGAQGGYMMLLVLFISVIIGALITLYEYTSLMAPAASTTSTSSPRDLGYPTPGAETLPGVPTPPSSDIQAIQAADHAKVLLQAHEQVLQQP